MSAYYHFCLLYFFGWQELLIEHPEQLQPQEDLPFFLFFIIVTMTKVIMAARTRHITIVPIFAASHVSIKLPPLCRLLLIYFNLLCEFHCFIVRLYEHIDDEGEYEQCSNKSD